MYIINFNADVHHMLSPLHPPSEFVDNFPDPILVRRPL